MKKLLNAIWQFCSYLFWPRWGRKEEHCHGNYLINEQYGNNNHI